MKHPNYHAYIHSPQWRAKRERRLRFDDYRCVVCHQTAINVHHLHYRTLGNEDITHDLVSCCRSCHSHLDTIEKSRRRQPLSSNHPLTYLIILLAVALSILILLALATA